MLDCQRTTNRARSSAPAVLIFAALALTLLLSACGGGGGGASPGVPPTDLGLLASTQPSVLPMPFVNPLAEAATVTQTDSDGGFSIAPGALPTSVVASSTHTLDVRFVPLQTGVVAGSITLLYEGGSQTREITHQFQATGEAVVWHVSSTPIDFGLIDVGSSADRLVRFRNASSLSPVTLTGVHSHSPAYTVVGNPFPLRVDPGFQAEITLRFAPTGGGDDDGTVNLGFGDPGGPVRIPVRGSAPGDSRQTIIDFGQQALSGGRTSRLEVTVPADALSLTVEGYDSTSSAQLGLGELIGPGGKVYENTALTGAYVWNEGAEVFSTTVPNTDRTDVQLVPGGGTYSFRILRLSGFTGQIGVRAIIETRAPGTESQGTLDLNVWLANGLTVKAAGAASDSRLQNIIARLDTILSAQDIRLGKLDYYDVSNAGYDRVTSDAEFAQMLRTTAAAADTRLNLFFVQVALGGNVVGAAATISGPYRNGTTLSGVMSVYEGGFSSNLIGLIAAHEIGHFLGLYHTAEQNGGHDIIDDTASCPSNGSDAICPTPGGGYLMHWQAIGGSDITDGQGGVLRAHPLLRPWTGGLSKFTPIPFDAVDRLQAESLPPGWCGCCAAAHKPQPPEGR